MNNKNSLVFAFGIMIILLGMVFAGCTEEKVQTAPIEDFYGGWMAKEENVNESIEDVLYYHWSFYENESMNYVVRKSNETSNVTIAGFLFNYSVEKDILTLSSKRGPPLIFTYQFSDDKQTLTVISDNKASLTFNKVKE